MDFLVQFLAILIPILELAVLGRVIMSWVDREQNYKVSRILGELTDPLINPVRRILPSTGMIDFSPLIVLLLLQLLRRVVLGMAI